VRARPDFSESVSGVIWARAWRAGNVANVGSAGAAVLMWWALQ